ncbi:MAG: N-terminal acetyltransferase [Pleopsidium flavum]|nr:MAG: N-terminal acetyltransferase [Pleopsidium flavum]
MADLSHRAKYTEDQLFRYLDHINLHELHGPQADTFSQIKEKIATNPLKWLTTLQKHQTATVPFENLALHYSTHHSITLDPEYLFAKVVGRGRGGYCMENNCFFGTVLRTLGYRVVSVGARVSNATNGRAGGGYTGFSHMVNVITIDGKRYMVDVGFGSNGPTHPLPLVDAEVSVGIAPQRLRLLWTSIAQNTDPSQKLWVFQHQNDPQSPWQDAYCFTELEFLPVDYEVMNFKTSHSRTSWFTYMIVCVKLILEVIDEDQEVVGTVMLVGNEVKRRIQGKTELLITCKTEEERVQALEKWFDIHLTDKEKTGIMGMVTQLTAT